MEDRNLYFLVKFGQYEFMKKLFETGSIYMQRLRTFQDIEHDQIGDKNEGLSHILQPEQVVLIVNGTEINDITGPIRIVETTAYNPFIFCLYGFTNECINESGEHIDVRCQEFGDYAVVITDAKKFFQMIKDAFDNADIGNVEAQLVQYVSYGEHHGEMGAFRKFDKFSHQSEFRLVYENESLEPTYSLDIGSLEEVATLCSSDQVNSLIKVKV